MKYKPQTKEELQKLVEDNKVYLGDIDTSLINDMSYIFYMHSFKFDRYDFSGIETWNTSNVTNMSCMFYGAKKFNHNINNWNVSKVRDMRSMFYRCYSFNQPLNDWDISNVRSMSSMFEECRSFNQPLDKWDTSNVTDMSCMFYGAEKFNHNINNWNVSKVRNMRSMFYACYSFNQPLNNWNISNVRSMSSMFEECKSFNQPLNNWNLLKARNISYMFYKAKSFNQDLSSWNVSNISKMRNMFLNSGFKCYDSLEDWNIENLKFIDNIFDNDCIDNLSLKWILYLYAFSNYYYVENIIENNLDKIIKIALKINNKKVISAKIKLENIYYDRLKDLYSGKIFKNIEEAEQYAEEYYKCYDEVSFIDELNENNVLIKDKSREVNINVLKYIYLKYLELKRDIYKIAEVDSIIELLDRSSFLLFVQKLYNTIHKEVTIFVYGIYGGDEALKYMYIRECAATVFVRILYFNMHSYYAVRTLYNIYFKARKIHLREYALEKLQNIAKKFNLSFDDLVLKIVSNFEFDINGEKIINVYNREYKLVLKNNLDFLCKSESFPYAVKKEIKKLNKDILFIIERIGFILRKDFFTNKIYDYTCFKEIFIDNPVMNVFASNLIWKLLDKDNNFISSFRYDNGIYINSDNKKININNDNYVSLMHPIEMYDEDFDKWKKQLEYNNFIQPLPQLIKLNKNNLESHISKLNSIEVLYGNLKKFCNNNYMKPKYLNEPSNFYSLTLNKGDIFIIENNAQFYFHENDRVNINIRFENIQSEKIDKKFIYSCIMFLIYDLKLIDILYYT